MTQKLCTTAKRFGDRAIVCSVNVLSTIENDVEALKNSDHYGDAAKASVLHFYNFTPPETDFPVRSLILVAKAEPIVNVLFCLNGKEIPVFTPNPYRDARKPFEEPSHYLKKLFNENNYRLQEWGWGGPPHKMLAVRTGFAKYGRNNLAYVNGLGSHHSLELFVSDYECRVTKVHELQQMEQCKSCKKCINACPTQAINAERKQITAERCLTYLNEFVDLCDFPGWLDSAAHHGMHGCIRCQLACPMNKAAIITPVSFNEDETRMILDGVSQNDLPEETRNKLEAVGELDYLHLLPRNLSAVFSRMCH